MNLKKLSLVASAIALTLITLPHNANAKTPSTSTQQLAQAQPPSIKLSPQQQEKIKKINANIATQVKKVMTPQQIQQIEAGIKAGQTPRQAFGTVKFTLQQQQSIQQIFNSSQEEKINVLTPDQKRQLQEYQQSQQPRK
jgi:periplasmic protein CpxP/Spy